ncbi:MAG: hypothetical protein JXJ17_07520 [Anaerolineae bacterium]|nr:hypothetical protein [Anaerolineae bacterium]
MTKTNDTRRADHLYRAAAIMLAIYSLIELTDCITVVLMHFGVVPNYYPEIAFADINRLFTDRPLSLLPLFLFFTSNRIIAAIGLFKRRMWGFWMAIFVCASTIVVAPVLLPLTGSEMIIDGLIVFMLLLARFGARGLADSGETGTHPST